MKRQFGRLRAFKIILTLKTECATLTSDETFSFCCCRDLSWKSCKNSRIGVVGRVMGTQSIRPRSLSIHCLETTLGHCRWNILKVILSLYMILYNNHIHFFLINHVISWLHLISLSPTAFLGNNFKAGAQADETYSYCMYYTTSYYIIIILHHYITFHFIDMLDRYLSSLHPRCLETTLDHCTMLPLSTRMLRWSKSSIYYLQEDTMLL